VRVDVRPRKRNAPRPAEKSAPGFLQWIRGRACACQGNSPKCHGKMQAAHTNDKTTKGVGTKCADRFAIPLSLGCHWHQHEIGWPEFARRYLGGMPPPVIATGYWLAWPGRIAWERKQADNA
jgi:hypothetical protein